MPERYFQKKIKLFSAHYSEAFLSIRVLKYNLSSCSILTFPNSFALQLLGGFGQRERLAEDRVQEEGRAQGFSVPSLSVSGCVPHSSCVSSMNPDPARQPLPTWSCLSCSASIVVVDPVRWVGFWALATPSFPRPSSLVGSRAFLLLSWLSSSCPI